MVGLIYARTKVVYQADSSAQLNSKNHIGQWIEKHVFRDGDYQMPMLFGSTH